MRKSPRFRFAENETGGYNFVGSIGRCDGGPHEIAWLAFAAPEQSDETLEQSADATEHLAEEA